MNFSKRRIKMNNLKPSGIEWIGSIPVDWKTVPIYYVAKEVTTKNKTLLRKNAFKFFFGNIINKPNFNPDEDNYVNKTIRNYIIVNPGDIVINGLNLNFDFVTKRVGMVTRPGTITSAYISLRPKANVILPKYMLYILRTYDSEKAFHNMGGGVRKILNYDELSKSKIILPSISAQTRIIKFLDKKVSQIDDISKKIQQEITDLEEYRKSIITKAVTKGIDKNVPIKNSGDKMIGEIAASFKLVPLKYVANYNLHTLSDDTNPDFCFKYIDIGSVTTGHINKYQKLRFADAPSRARRLVKNNDIIISTVRTYLKAIAFIQDLQKTTVVSTGFIVLSPKKNLIDPVYLRYAIENESFISKVQAYSVGITYPAINSSTIMNFKLVYPPFNAQKEIASYLDKKCKSINQIIEKKRTLINSLNQYKQSIIYEYVTGKKQVSSEEGVQE